MRLSNIALAITAMYGGFSPASLFAGGANGVWYDPSDTSTLFQDPAGTTPVTAVEQPVGLMLDKSKGLVLGSELISGGVVGLIGTATAATYNTATGAGTATRVDINNQSFVSWTGLSNSTTYRLTISCSSGSTFVRAGGAPGSVVAQVNSGNTITVYVNPASNDITLTAAAPSGSTAFTVVSFRALPGNHAISYNSTTARPTLSARVNLLTYSEQFDNGAWIQDGSTITANTTTAPDGTTTSDTIKESSANSQHIVRAAVPTDVGRVYTISAFAKPNGRDFLHLSYNASSANFFAHATFDVNTGVVTQSGAVGYTLESASITAAANGFYRCVLSFTVVTVGGASPCFGVSDTGTPSLSITGRAVYAGDVTKGLYLWGADFRLANIGSAVPSYQRIAAATDYDTNGFPKYLYFAGTDDGMSTPANLNLTSTDKVTVFSGVRKLSDAAVSVLTELSADWNSNTGSFISVAPDATGANGNYTAASRGTAATNINQYAVSAITLAPVTNVVTATHDIPGDLSAIRLNGAASGTNGTGDKGSGNFGTYPLYIGSRNNASFWFNGYLYGLTVVGAQLTTPQIESMETWTGGKTGISVFNQGPSISLDFTDQSYQVWEI